eukprot:TRINITY_DN1153_c0_g2_i1.p2 TRINITY_DN1153_c0_g2~~TRINITY_DN1153_c0_g2_i1.p2  ORF type:complete len:576 (+),score=207.86 TRINITY_DN1153_c0_g2_i1:55-1782(+)
MGRGGMRRRQSRSTSPRASSGFFGGGGRLMRSLSTGGRRQMQSGAAAGAEHLDSSMLIVAALQGDAETAAKLVRKRSVDVNYADYAGRTALHHAAKAGNLPLVTLLVSEGNANANVPDHDGRAPIIDARAAGAGDVVAFLKSHGAVDSSKWIAKMPRVASESACSLDGMAGDAPVRSAADASGPGQAAESTGQEVAPAVLQKMALLMSVPFVVLLLLQGSWFIVCFILLTFLYFFLVGAYLVSEVSIRPPWYEPTPQTGSLTKHGLPAYWQGIYTNPRYDHDLVYDDVEFSNERQQTLRGWWVPAAPCDPAPDVAVVMVHGGGRDRRAWLRHVPMFNEEGYPCLLFDFREHGLSDGTCRGFSYGSREKYDVLAAVEWTRRVKGAKRVVIIGTSVGGSAVILAAAKDAKECRRNADRSRIIDLCIAENPPARATELQSYHMNSALEHYAGSQQTGKLLLRAFDELAQLFLRIRIGIFPRGPQALDVVGTLMVPLLLMHGTGDDVVPHQHSERLFRSAAGDKELWMAPDAFHCGLYDRYPQEFRQRVFGFIRQHVRGSPRGLGHYTFPAAPDNLSFQ